MAAVVGFKEEDLKDAVDTARCSRCGGFMVAEWSVDLSDNARPASRCVQCGERVDPVILRNRRMQLLHGLGTRARN